MKTPSSVTINNVAPPGLRFTINGFIYPNIAPMGRRNSEYVSNNYGLPFCELILLIFRSCKSNASDRSMDQTNHLSLLLNINPNSA